MEGDVIPVDLCGIVFKQRSAYGLDVLVKIETDVVNVYRASLRSIAVDEAGIRNVEVRLDD